MNLSLEEVVDAFRKRHALSVAQLRVRLRLTVAAAAYGGGLVALREGIENRALGRGGKLEFGFRSARRREPLRRPSCRTQSSQGGC